MPWRNAKVEDQRLEFVVEIVEKSCSVSEACRKYNISRSTGYKWLKRYEEEGVRGLGNLSRRPVKLRAPTRDEVMYRIIKIRKEHPYWGGKTIRAYLQRNSRFKDLPHSRTIDRILKKCGFVTPKKYKQRIVLPESEIVEPINPNDVWATDFKGWWWMQNKERCKPLTIRDRSSRFLLEIGALGEQSFEATKSRFELAFNIYGLPLYILSDNGVPFANVQNIWGLTRLSVWWLKLGITPIRTGLGCPYENGSLERMHKDMAEQLEISPEKNLQAEQARFDRWRYDYNYIRPNHALNMSTPSEMYQKSPREYNKWNSEYLYPSNFETRTISKSGRFYWGRKDVNFSRAFSGEIIGIEPIDCSTLRIWYRDFFLGTVNRDFQKGIVPPKKLGKRQK